MCIKKYVIGLLLLFFSTGLFAHGLIESPASRSWMCGAVTKPDQVDNGTAKYPFCGTAFAVNPIAGYSFMSIVTHALGRASVTPLPTHVCSFDSETWKGAQTPWDVPMDWPTNPMSAGVQAITWNITWGPHFDDTAGFRYWITKPTFIFSPTKELTWNDFEATPFCDLTYDDKNPTANANVSSDKATGHFTTKCTVPARNGHHVIYGEWGRIAPTFERFHGCIDAAFSGVVTDPVVAQLTATPTNATITGANTIAFSAAGSQGVNLSYYWSVESPNPSLYSFSNSNSASTSLSLKNPQAETAFTVRLTVSDGNSTNSTTKTFTQLPSGGSNWADMGALSATERTLNVGDKVQVRMVDASGVDSYFPDTALTINAENTASTAWPSALAQAVNNMNGSKIKIGVLNNNIVTPTQTATTNRIYAVTPTTYVSAFLAVINAPSSQCNWYGTVYPICTNTASGWGYENNKSCITTATCVAQPAPYGIVPGSTASSTASSLASSKSSVASSITASVSSKSSSSIASSASSSVVVTGVIFQDNFENGVVNTQPAGWDNYLAWVYNASNLSTASTFALIDNSKAYTGTKSIHFKGSLAEIVRALPAGTQRLHMRAYVNLSKKIGNDAADNHEHIMGIKKTQDANNEVRVGQIKGVLGTNDAPSDNIAPPISKWFSGTELKPNVWYCVETAMYADTDYDQLYMWVNGSLVHSITSDADWNNGALGANWLSDKFHYAMFGFHSFDNASSDVWMDDIVVSTQPIGCGISSSSSSAASSIASSARSSAATSSIASSVKSSVASSASSSIAANNCTYVITDEWNTGFNGVIRIKNNRTTAINSWSVNWAYSDGSKLINSWNVGLAGTNPYAATNMSYNSTISPGQTVEFGFQGTKGSSATALTPMVTGAACN